MCRCAGGEIDHFGDIIARKGLHALIHLVGPLAVAPEAESGQQKERKLVLGLYVYEEQENSVRVQVANLISDYLTAVGFGIKVNVENFYPFNVGNFSLLKD